MKWIGLTGSIATGKSTVKRLIEGLGFPVIDADLIAHQVSAKGTPGIREIASHFGTEILNADQSLDRKKLAGIVFSDDALRLKLEGILHPLIQVEVQKQKAQFAKAGHAICFYDVPLLFEKNLQSNFDLVVLVWCEQGQQLQRLMARNGLTYEEAMARMSPLTPMCEKVSKADRCVDNSTDLGGLELQIKHLIKTLGQ